MKSAILAAVAAASIGSATAGTAATVIYDNFGNQDFAVEISGRSYTAVFRSDINQTVTGIGARVSAPTNGNLNFVILDLGNGPAPASVGTLVFSAVTAITADASFSHKYSNPFSFAMTAGKWYAAGAIADSAYSLSFDSRTSVNPGPTFTAFANQNMNFTDFANPTPQPNFGCCNAHYQLLSGSTAVVPEPASWAMLIMGFGLVGAVMRRRVAATAA